VEAALSGKGKGVHMEALLQAIATAPGVTAAFVCSGAGKVEASAVPGEMSAQALETVARTLTQTLGGIELARKRKVGDLDMGFAGGRLLVKALSPGCLCLLTVKRVNVALVNLSANVTVKKIKDLRKAAGAVPEAAAVAATASVPAEPLEAPASPAAGATAVVDSRVLSLIERELARALGSEAQLVLYYEIAATGMSKAAFPRACLGDLVERLSGEIGEVSRRETFLQASTKIIMQG